LESFRFVRAWDSGLLERAGLFNWSLWRIDAISGPINRYSKVFFLILVRGIDLVRHLS